MESIYREILGVFIQEKYLKSIYRRNTCSSYTGEILGVYIHKKYMESI